MQLPLILDDLVGTGENFGALIEEEGEILTVKELLELLKLTVKINQFEWADFFLFKEYPASWDDPPGTLYPQLISQTHTTVRAIDNRFMYIYTPSEEVVNLIKNTYVIESFKIGSLEHMEYPC